MPRLPRVTASQMARAIERAGFSLSRQSGSHAIYRNAAGRRITLPVHAGKVLHPKVVASIIADAGWTVDELITLLS